jgi:hypothetical protein
MMVACENCNKFWFASLTLVGAAATIKESIAVTSTQHLLFPSQKKVLERQIAAVDAGIEVGLIHKLSTGFYWSENFRRFYTAKTCQIPTISHLTLTL